MKKILPLNIVGYEFDELRYNSQETAICDHVSFWMEGGREYDIENKGNFERACDKAEELKTPWFTGSYVYDYCKDEIIEQIVINKYLFDEEGELIPLLYHVDVSGNVEKITYSVTKTQKIEVQVEDC